MREEYKIKLKWKIYHGDLKDINSFEYSCFKFKCKLNTQELMEKFAEVVCSDGTLLPWDICNFFLRNDVPYSINFRYVRPINFHGNYILWKAVMFLKKQKIKLDFNNWKDSFEIKPTIEKKLNNEKERYEFMFHILNKKSRKLFFVEVDSNIWWKPKIIKRNFESCSRVFSIGWLFMQIGLMKFKEKRENDINV
ncbi:hypothetical protein [Clostridium tagluense]|uniref:Uncharacterized protein n=1 Tax=Clostridium tagluense TaxID=360422 RepID=A0A401UQE9_9CLOT|nr:hypothetical protein [Clostridium tagluense]GCD11746.1 hypothetical protein Ctaglu_33690 [Clostridium tagluense]